jgi:hypothetical protein
MLSGGQQGSLSSPSPSPPPPPLIRSLSSSSLSSIAVSASTCQIPLTPRVPPPRSCAWHVLSAPHAMILVGDDGRPSAPTSGPRPQPPPPVRCHSLTMLRCCHHHPLPSRHSAPPLRPVLVHALWGVQRIDRRCRKCASLVAFFSAPTVVGVPFVAVATAAAHILLGVAVIWAREVPAPAPRGLGQSRNPTAKPGASSLLQKPPQLSLRSFFSLLPLSSSRWMALVNSTARSLARRHCCC